MTLCLPIESGYTDESSRRAAVAERDTGAEGAFVFAVRTTGVFCRPSCKARPARPENVTFYDTPADAEAAGYRACKRCRPDGIARDAEQAAVVAAACRRLDQVDDELPTLDTLAAGAGMSPFHFHRLFKAATGVTPRRYAEARRRERVQAALASGETVTAALYDAGFNSASRFYAAAQAMLGMAPARARKGGNGEHVRFALKGTSLGRVLVAASAQGVVDVRLGDDDAALVAGLHQRFPSAEIGTGDAEFAALVIAVVASVEGDTSASPLPLDIRGTAFQARVWQALLAIPAGEIASYAEVAERIGASGSSRAVASACAANTLAVLVPCHRVVKSDGAISGYRWGVERKRALLEREAADR